MSCSCWVFMHVPVSVVRTSLIVLSLAATCHVANLTPTVCAQEIPEISSVSELESMVSETWTNHAISRISLPASPFQIGLQEVAYDGSMDTNFIAALTPVTNGAVTLFPISVYETNGATRERIYLNASGQAVLTSQVSGTSFPESWITNTYGEVPSYLTPAEETQWFADRDTDRGTLTLELLSTTDVDTLIAQYTNAVSSSGTNLLALYSNDLALVGITVDQDVYVHGPTNILIIDVFGSESLIATQAWSHLSVLSHSTDPVLFQDATETNHEAYAAGDAGLDEDDDNIASGRELLLYHTDPLDADSDNDGLNDNLELFVYGTDPNDTDSDDDGLTDGEEHDNGYNPTSDDTDGDGLDDGYEIATRTDPLNPDTTIPIVYLSIPTNNQEMVVTP